MATDDPSSTNAEILIPMRAYQLFGLLIVSMATFVGCTSGDTAVVAKPPVAQDELKKTLEGLLKSGESMGSAGYTIQQAVDQIKAVDKAKGDALQPDCDKLMSTGNPAEIKKLAESMLKKL